MRIRGYKKDVAWEELLRVLERRRWAGTVIYSAAPGGVGTFAIFL